MLRRSCVESQLKCFDHITLPDKMIDSSIRVKVNFKASLILKKLDARQTVKVASLSVNYRELPIDPVVTRMTDPEHSIQHIDRQQRCLELTWNDGHHSSYHYIWLRDNCACPKCGDRNGGHRYLELGSIDADITPDEVSVDDSGSLQIKWTGDKHLSSYAATWLRAN